MEHNRAKCFRTQKRHQVAIALMKGMIESLVNTLHEIAAMKQPPASTVAQEALTALADEVTLLKAYLALEEDTP